MKVIAQILDIRDDGESQCYLSKVSLEDYVNGLPTTYQDYDVQRGIVSNVYLDHLVDTIINKRHIPPIVLVVENNNYKRKDDVLEITSFKILDGLQRTFRLQAIRETIRYCLENIDNHEEYIEWSKFKFSRQFSADMRNINSTTKVLRSVLQGLITLGKDGLISTYTENTQWFEVWTGLSPDEEVRKMLMLNAGHKPVKTRHQLELLFLNLLPFLQAGESKDFQLVREKDVSSTSFSKNRQCGSFHFAHLISSLLSLISCKPITPSADLIQDIQSDDSMLEGFGELINPKFLKDFIAFLVHLDQLVMSQYGDIGTVWMGREVSLAGLFGALGMIARDSGIPNAAVFQKFMDLLNEYTGILNLEQFEKVRNSLDLSKINIGVANRRATYSAIASLLTEQEIEPIDWRTHFKSEGA